MDKKMWKRLQEDLKELSLEEQLAELRKHLKQITGSDLAKEVQTAIHQRELQQHFLVKAKEKIQEEVVHRQQAEKQRQEQPEQQQFVGPQSQEQISLENVVKTIVGSPGQEKARINESGALQYLQQQTSEQKNPYHRESTPYALSQNNFLHEGLGTHVFADQQTALKQREREEEQRRAIGSTQQMLESRDFAEYKTTRQQKKFQV